MKHELKIQPVFFKAVAVGSKTFEVRRDDRGFEMDDTLVLKEHRLGFDNPGYTGSEIEAVVERVWDRLPGIRRGYVVLSIRVVEVRHG